jgi:CheY-like chemotaxis protein
MAGRILVLDDEENYAEMLQDLLRENNYRVDMATRPERAILQLEDIPYDLVISDYKMPVMDGADFLKKARELYPNLPFILVSGLMNTPELVKVANMSVTLVMEKPLDTEVFLAHVARFSDPMTDEERANYERDEGDGSGVASSESLPAEPCFFSAKNFLSNRFLQQAWALAEERNDLYILEPEGSDVSLLFKDLSHWLGWADYPVEVVELPESDDAAVERVRGILADTEKSRLVGLLLKSTADIARARRLTATIQPTGDASKPCLLVYVLSGDASVEDFIQATAGRGICLPPLASRPSDLATYAHRLARIAAERSGRQEVAKWTPEAMFALLAFDWPQNYKQLQKVIPAAADAGGNAPVSLEALTEVLGRRVEVPDANERLAQLMSAEQTRFLESQIKQGEVSVTELAKNLNLDGSIQTSEDLKKIGLLDAKFGRFE